MAAGGSWIMVLRSAVSRGVNSAKATKLMWQERIAALGAKGTPGMRIATACLASLGCLYYVGKVDGAEQQEAQRKERSMLKLEIGSKEATAEGSAGRAVMLPSIWEIEFYRNPLTQPGGQIVLANAAVFCLWQLPFLRPFMAKNFVVSLEALRSGRLHTLVTSFFSHSSFLHFLFNQVALASFTKPVMRDLYLANRGDLQQSKKDWWTTYMMGGLSSSMSSMFFRFTRGRYLDGSLGSSGAVLAMLYTFAVNHPQDRLGIIFLPSINFSAATGAKALLAFDFLGLFFSGSKFDHAGHLGGSLFGLAAQCYRDQSFTKAQNLLLS